MSWALNEFQDETWLDIIGYQSGHAGNPEMWDWIVAGPPATDWIKEPIRSFINLEPVFEHVRNISGETYRIFEEHIV
jgi:hypothetical protein